MNNKPMEPIEPKSTPCFHFLKEKLKALHPKTQISLDLNVWYESGEWIAGFTKESRLANLEAYLEHCGFVFSTDPMAGNITISKRHEC